MFQNYLKIALRNLLRHKTYSLINILGLSLGLACCLLLALYIEDEWSYDKHHHDLDQIYRINTYFQSDKGIDQLGTTSPPIATTLDEEMAEIEVAARLVAPPGVAQNLIRYEDVLFYEPGGYIADSTLFDVLTYDFIEGNPNKALTDVNSVVLTLPLAKKLFGNESALNKLISISQGGAADQYKVTGVVHVQEKSIIKANFFTSWNSTSGMATYLRSPEAQGEWAGQNFVPAFVKLGKGQKKENVEKKMNQLLVKYGSDDMKAMGFTKTLGLEPIKDIYLKSSVSGSKRITYLYVVASIALFILLIACINFMNLSTAKATKRANEVGLRKVMGAYRSTLMTQFLGEAFGIVLISVLISVALIQMTLPFFNDITGKNISLGTGNLFYFGTALVIITVATGLIAGSYPAFYLTSFQPAQVLKGKVMLGNASGWLRQSLVAFQFLIAIALVCGMITVSQQLDFMQQSNLGFDTQARIVLPLRTETAQKKYESLKKELEKQTFVKAIAGTEYIPGSTIWSDMSFYTSGGTMDNAIMNKRNAVDYGYLHLMNIKLIAGRDFNDNRESEGQTKLIINRTSAKKFGFEPEKIIGESLFFDWQGKNYKFEVIGVMEDFHQTSLKERIEPIMFAMPKTADQYAFVVMNVKTENFKATLSTLEQTWKSMIDDTPFEYSFLDETIQKQYDDDRKIAQIITGFSFIAMIICSLGLYGLSTYMAERRFKEIGVRKVLGASIKQIVAMMSQEFVRLVLIAFVIAVPIAWYGLNQWLNNFAYRINVNGWVFVMAGTIALIIALLTVSYESIKAASADPAKSLRTE